MVRRACWIGGWAALVGGVLAAAAAASVIVVGVLALSGRVTYPVDVGVGPLSMSQQISIPVAFGGDVCQSASVREQDPSVDCLRFFVHDAGWATDSQADPIRVQDADVRPTSATLTGTVQLATTGGWNGLVAASVARTAILLSVASAVLVLVSRLLATFAAGRGADARSLRQVRAIGWLLVAGGAAEMVFSLFSSASQFGYSVETFGSGPHLDAGGTSGVDVYAIAVGGLVLIVGELFRRAAVAESTPAA